MGFPEKGGWHIKLDKGLHRLAEIYFSERDATSFCDWLISKDNDT
jgi:hypothetical protein